MNSRFKRNIKTKGFLRRPQKNNKPRTTLPPDDVLKEYFYFEFKDSPKRTRKSIIFSSRYYILCNVEDLTPKSLQYIHRVQPDEIALDIDCYLYHFQGDVLSKNIEIKKTGNFVVNKFTYWLSVKTIYYLLSCGESLNPINNEFIGWGKLYLETDENHQKWIENYTKENKLMCSNINYIEQFYHF